MSTSHLPNFFLLGATKCGTTSLHHYIRQHPEVFMPYEKELHFFNQYDVRNELDSYLALFEQAGDRVSGEATPGYFREPDVVIPFMKEVYGKHVPRFIVLLRDPVRRAYSHFMHNVRSGHEERSFEQALAEEYENFDGSHRRWKSYFRDGLYAKTLSEWWKHYPQDQFLVILTEDLNADTGGVTRKVFRFLGVRSDVQIDTDARLNQNAGSFRSQIVHKFLGSPPLLVHKAATTFFPKSVRSNVRQFIQRMNKETAERASELSPSVERKLRKRYAQPTRRLSTMIERDLSHWLPS